MKTKLPKLFHLFIITITFLFIQSCKDDETITPVQPPVNVTAPTVTTTSIINITTNSASGGGNVTAEGSSSVTARGVCWSTSQNPTTANSKTTDGTGTGSYTSSITGLSPQTTYYVRAYATNSSGTSYGSQVSFTTAQTPTAPTVTTTSITNITTNSATGGGNVTSQGSSSVTARGVCWSTTQNPTTSNTKTTNGTGTGSFTSSITGLSPSTPYYVRAYATNNAGTSYGNQVSFTTQGQAQIPGISAPSTSSGTFVVSVTYNWPVLGTNFDGYELEESTSSPNSGFTKIQSSPGGTHTSPYNFTVTRNAGTYYYRARVSIGGPINYSPYSSVVTVVVTQPKATLKIVNNTKYFMIDIQLNGVQKVGQGLGLDIGGSMNFEFNNSGTVTYKLGVGFWDNTYRNVWFILSGTAQVLSGSTTTITFNNPTIAQLLTNFQSSNNWKGYYYDANYNPHTAIFTFFNNNTWKLYNDGSYLNTGIITLISWPNYATIVTFKLCPTCSNIQLPYPFATFYYNNGPASWPIIEYVRQ